MQLTIFGATGKVGTLLVDQALQAGHEVTAVVRDPARLTPTSHGRPQVITADVMDPDAIAAAVTGADAVLSALGSAGRGPTSILGDSSQSIISAMEKVGATRLITVSGSMVDDTGDGPFLRYVGKPITRRILKNVCADMRRAEDQIHAASLTGRFSGRRTFQIKQRPESGAPRSIATCHAASGSPVLTSLSQPHR